MTVTKLVLTNNKNKVKGTTLPWEHRRRAHLPFIGSQPVGGYTVYYTY